MVLAIAGIVAVSSGRSGRQDLPPLPREIEEATRGYLDGPGSPLLALHSASLRLQPTADKELRRRCESVSADVLPGLADFNPVAVAVGVPDPVLRQLFLNELGATLDGIVACKSGAMNDARIRLASSYETAGVVKRRLEEIGR